MNMSPNSARRNHTLKNDCPAKAGIFLVYLQIREQGEEWHAIAFVFLSGIDSPLECCVGSSVMNSAAAFLLFQCAVLWLCSLSTFR